MENNTITFEELINITSKVRENNDVKKLEKIKSAREDAIKHITESCYEKMVESAKKGRDKANLYSFQWVDDKESTHDKNGVQTIFGENIRLLDLITKDRIDFIKDLNSFFNKEGETKYKCGFFKNINDKDKSETWIIYVSWRTEEQMKVVKNKRI